MQIALGPHVFGVYRNFLTYHSPVLAGVLSGVGQTTSTLKLRILADIDIDVFGLFVQWMYTESLLSENLEPAYQHQLMAVWILAKRLQIPKLQNDSIDMLEEQRQMEGGIQDKTFAYVYSNTVRGDTLRRYLVDACCRSATMFLAELVETRLPLEMVREIRDVGVVELGGGDVVEERLEMEKYHVS